MTDGKNNHKDIMCGLQLDNPAVFLPWDITETSFLDLFQNHDVSRVGENGGFIVMNVTVFGERRCNLWIEFRNTVRIINIARDSYGEFYPDIIRSPKALKRTLMRSYKVFQSALIRELGNPNERKLNSPPSVIIKTANGG